MNKFKAGDRVKRVKLSEYPHRFGVVGQEYTVIYTRIFGISVIEGFGGADPSCFELVTPQEDYNDGKWHIWNGGKCPLHGEKIVDITWYDGIVYTDVTPYEYNWDQPLMFRVVTPYVEPKEPREFWVDPKRCIARQYPNAGFIHVREVIENDA